MATNTGERTECARLDNTANFTASLHPTELIYLLIIYLLAKGTSRNINESLELYRDIEVRVTGIAISL